VSQPVVSSTGTGAGAATINIDGTGGGSGSLSEINHGVLIQSAGTRIRSIDGDIELTGTPGAGINSHPIQVDAPDAFEVTGAADVTLTENIPPVVEILASQAATASETLTAAAVDAALDVLGNQI
jgi:hypothetical protein